MKIIKIFNNNCVATIVDGKEQIVTGLGLGFDKKEGDELDVDRIEKTFHLLPQQFKRFSQLIEEIDFDYFRLTQDLMAKAEKDFDLALDDKLFIFLSDHMSSAVKRFEEGMYVPNLMNEEFKLFYPKEYALALWAVSEIKKRFEIVLPEDEASYITVHIVNASVKDGHEDVHETVEMIAAVLAIVESQTGRELDREDLSVMRFQTHLKYLAQRILSGSDLVKPEKPHLKMIFQFRKYQDLVDQIAYYIQERFHYSLNMDEKLYLMLHLDRMLS